MNHPQAKRRFLLSCQEVGLPSPGKLFVRDPVEGVAIRVRASRHEEADLRMSGLALKTAFHRRPDPPARDDA